MGRHSKEDDTERLFISYYVPKHGEQDVFTVGKDDESPTVEEKLPIAEEEFRKTIPTSVTYTSKNASPGKNWQAIDVKKLFNYEPVEINPNTLLLLTILFIIVMAIVD